MWNKETNRPDDWENPYEPPPQEGNDRGFYEDPMEYTAYKDGADAIVEPAKAEGRRELIEFLKEHSYKPSSGIEGGLHLNHWDWQQLLEEIK